MNHVHPQHIANYFLDKARSERQEITHLKLQKLVYIAYGWTTYFQDEPLFKESLEAWDHGPVIPSLFHEFKAYGHLPIKDSSCMFENPDKSEDDEYKFSLYIPRLIPDRNKELFEVLEFVWRNYSKYSAFQLRALTHKEGTPWSNHYKQGEKGIVIPFTEIKEHFEYLSTKLRKRKDERKKSTE